MRHFARAITILGFALVTAAVAPMRTTAAAQPYCPNAAHATPAKVPADLVASVAQAFQVDEAVVRDAAFVRCAGAKLKGCYVGANLNCFKAETRRTLPGATAWCRANPGSESIPMSATGHATIYDWTCKDNRAVAGQIVMPVDPQGYVAGNWREVR